MEISQNPLNIIKKLNAAGYQAYFVGGCVRDMLMEKTPKDWDITTSAKPEDVKRIFPKTIDTGIKHGTVSVMIQKEAYEVTTYRIDGDYKDYRRPQEVCFTSSLREDLLRRDFTMNAIAFHPEEGFLDFFGGKEDIKNKNIKGVGDAATRFKEDALRMLRAIRFSCQLGFNIEEKTFSALKANSHLISHISIERIRDELTKAFVSEYVEKSQYFLKCDIIYTALNFFCDYLMVNLKSFLATLPELDIEKRNPVAIYSLLFMNIDEASICRGLKKMKLDNDCIKSVSAIGPMITKFINPEPYEIKRAILKLGIDDFFILLNLKEANGENIHIIREIAQNIIIHKEPLFLKDLDINGNIIMDKLNVKGKATGEVLAYLHDQVLKNPSINKREMLLQISSKAFQST